VAEILWSTEVNAPCCPGEIVELLPKSRRTERDEDTGRVRRVEPRTLLIQTDWDYPGVAQSFGWSLRDVQKDGGDCDHEATDGTVPCKQCGLTQTDFISAAYDWLCDNDGATAEDPGYFGGDE
jgi:hypothetical protein